MAPAAGQWTPSEVDVLVLFVLTALTDHSILITKTVRRQVSLAMAAGIELIAACT